MGFMKGALAGGEQAETAPPPPSIPPSLTPGIIHHVLGVGVRNGGKVRSDQIPPPSVGI